MTTWNIFLSSLAQLILLVNVVLGWRLPPKEKKHLAFFYYYLVLGLVIQITARIVMYQGMTNLPFLHIYTLLEFVLLSLFYRNLLIKDGVNRTYALYFIGFISSLIILNSLFVQTFTQFNSYAKTLTQLIYMGYAVAYFFQTQYKKGAQTSEVLIILNSSILIYYSGSLFTFMFSNVFLEIGGLQMVFWIMNTTFYLIFQLVIAYCLWKQIYQ